MKKFIISVLLILVTINLTAQSDPTADQRVITTAVPFVLIAADARAAGMGDIGVTTSADAFSQQWNAAKNLWRLYFATRLAPDQQRYDEYSYRSCGTDSGRDPWRDFHRSGRGVTVVWRRFSHIGPRQHPELRRNF